MFAIIDAPGYYGNSATVWEVHADLKSAVASKLLHGQSVVIVDSCTRRPGDKISAGALADMIARMDVGVIGFRSERAKSAK